MNINMDIDQEGVEIETKSVRDRRFKRNSNEFEVEELSIESVPVQSINDTDITYNLNNSTLGNHTNTETNTYSESDVLWTVIGPFLMVILCICSNRAHVPSTQYHRGAMIRRQAERVWAIERVKTERQGVPIETRKSQINDNLRKMKVISKCARTGHCILGAVEVEELEINHDSDEEGTNEALSTTGECSTISEDIEAISDASSTANEDEEPSLPASTTDEVASTVVAAAAASRKSESECPESPGKAERRPLLSSDSEDSAENFGSVTETKELPQSPSNNSCATTSTPSCYDNFDDDEDVCPICLDNFEDEEPSLPASTTDEVASTVAAAAAASPKSESKCPESPGKAERRPLLSSDSEDSGENFGSVTETKELPQSPSNNSYATTSTPSCYDNFDDDEDVCPICLDNFEVGDSVMFSRHNHNSCSHVFHEDCLLQWLLEQRENECPTCRACFITDQATETSLSSSTSDTDENSSFLSDELEDSSTDDETMGDEISGDIEEGMVDSESGNSTHNYDNSGGDCVDDYRDDSSKTRDNEQKIVDGEEENDSLETGAVDEMEQGFTYVIVKGSVQRIPS